LQPRPLQIAKRGALLPDHRQQQHQRGAGAQPQQLPDRIGRHQEFAERVAKREHEDAKQHQADAGQACGAFIEGGCLCEEGHAGALKFLFCVMAGHSRSKNGVASLRLCPGHPRLP
jgi:hypothetical protein